MPMRKGSYMSTFELTKSQIDELSEIANISMGNAATNLSITIIRETHIKNMYWKPHILTG